MNLPSPADRLAELEDALLAPFAMRSRDSRGRVHSEPEHPRRLPFMRDRDRVVHSGTFRRLMYKTQVFVGQPDDHQRTRLTHTIEVAQIARTIARLLRLNEDLTEAIALAHDLGHPPFGHAGERVLAERTSATGPFEHNRHGLKIVTTLERPYPNRRGLNLTFETLESIAHRCKDPNHPLVRPLRRTEQAPLEGQVVDAADAIAYDAHDVDDALRAGLIDLDSLRPLEIWRRSEDAARNRLARSTADAASLAGKDLARAVIRALIDEQVGDVVENSAPRLSKFDSPESAMTTGTELIGCGERHERSKRELESFLFERVYRHPRTVRSTERAGRMLSALFDQLIDEPNRIPEKYLSLIDDQGLEQSIADYVASMTDRYVLKLHREWFEP